MKSILRAPMLCPALGVVLGAVAARELAVPPTVAALIALAALGLAWRSPAGALVAGLAIGALRAGGPPADPVGDLGRPVDVVGAVVGHPVVQDGESLLRVRGERWRQGRTVTLAACDVLVTLPAGGDEAPAIGTRVRLRGFLRRTPPFANGTIARPGPWRLRLASASFLQVETPPGAVGRLSARLRAAVAAALAGDGHGTALARALLLGDRSRLPWRWEPTLRRFGLSHLLAVSGLHVGLLAALALLATLPLPRGLRLAAALLAVALYALLVGPRPSVVRAAAMGVLGLGALLVHRPPHGLNALASGVIVMVLHQPEVVGELAFQLSAAATAALVVLAPLFFERWRAIPPAWRRPLAATCAAQLATLPFLVPLTGTWHPLAALLNLAAVPWLALFLGVAFVALGLGALPLAAPALDLLAAPLDVLAACPPSPLDLRLIGAGPWAATGLALALLALALWPRRAAVVATGGLVLVALARIPEPSPAAEVVLLDVGQGSAVVVRDGPRALLVDGGGWPRGDLGGRVLLPALAELGVRRLDALVMTHPDRDHCGGLRDLTAYLPVATVALGSGWGAPCARDLESAPGARWRVLWAGETLRLGRWRLDVLHPRPGERLPEDNDRSLVLMASHAGRRVLLTGDVEAEAERRLVRRWGEALHADVLEVAHHGSKTSTTAAFLRAVAPRWALISAGRANPYGHPSPEVLSRLAEAGVQVRRTDLGGRVIVEVRDDGRLVVH